MATNTGARATTWQLTEVEPSEHALLEELAVLTRRAFAVGDMLPGLPDADGAHDTAASIRADLDAGIRLWMAHAGDGRPVGCVRAIPRPDRVWQIRRLAVALTDQGAGLGRLLVRGLERAALAEGVRRLVVWALVERGIAPLYSKLGYRTTGHLGTPDKPLSEAVMELDLGRPSPPLAYPWGTQPRCPYHGGLMVTWFGSASRTVAVTDRLTANPRPVVARQQERVTRLLGTARFLGGDGWADCPPRSSAAVCDTLAARADTVDGRVLVFERPYREVVEYTMPRTVAPELLALWRVPGDPVH
ncbi:GNAT family N-acetyltransferase [Actinophytocola oryzae]|uniref:Acetyltransferase (GNAT) family protein n=1 Tax=Actinophytocola oryzae TaxID=502181 RepID=A0A4R7V1L7_9PSEU|nr:GNAT family N-acetyltransferase [Actinophytocola oryzae]TDV43198.1 acetyltransferase (GNAT) family protein [Actinophytocola oryzae]